jgi:hypothetical protein
MVDVLNDISFVLSKLLLIESTKTPRIYIASRVLTISFVIEMALREYSFFPFSLLVIDVFL